MKTTPFWHKVEEVEELLEKIKDAWLNGDYAKILTHSSDAQELIELVKVDADNRREKWRWSHRK